jgi:8-oxo-dGTP pyrophosphatase MutT (NUDIX family)
MITEGGRQRVPEGLLARYASLADPVTSGGTSYPVAVGAAHTPVTDLLRISDTPAPLDHQLLAAGADHLARVQATQTVFDGTTLVLDRIEDNTLIATPSTYFAMLATCDALREEWVRRGTGPLRDRADSAAGGDPLHRGTGRAAAIGVSVVVTVTAGSTHVLLGRRRSDLATDPGKWHVVPSGMLEPTTSGDPLIATVRHELTEELGVEVSAQFLTQHLRTLGFAFDLLRLRPEICLALDLGDATDLQIRSNEYDACRKAPAGAALAALALHHAAYRGGQ